MAGLRKCNCGYVFVYTAVGVRVPNRAANRRLGLVVLAGEAHVIEIKDVALEMNQSP